MHMHIHIHTCTLATFSELSRDLAEISWFSENPYTSINIELIFIGKFQEISLFYSCEKEVLCLFLALSAIASHHILSYIFHKNDPINHICFYVLNELQLNRSTLVWFCSGTHARA